MITRSRALVHFLFHSRKHRRRKSSRLRVEPLEARRMMAAYLVDTDSDRTIDDGLVSLREAIEAANASHDVTDTISFAPSLQGKTIRLRSQLPITDSLSIQADATEGIQIDGIGQLRLFNIDAGGGQVSLTGLTLRGGRADRGGAIFVGSGSSLSLEQMTLDSNTASAHGGAIFVSAGAELSVIGSTFDDNIAEGGGGAIANSGFLSIDRTQFDSNRTASSGGGIWQSETGFAVLTDSRFINGTAGETGGAISNENGNLRIVRSELAGNTAAHGGAIYQAGSAAELSIDRTTLAENVATAEGGAIASAAGTVSLVNSTISGNAAGETGGGMDVLRGDLSLHSVTIAMNQAERGGGIANASGTLSTTNSILGSNNAAIAPDISGSLVSGGNNLIEHATDAALLSLLPSDLTGERPRLTALSNYGGATRTHALQPASPAIGAGVTPANRIDQRGQRRHGSEGFDMGAFESPLADTIPVDLNNVTADDAIFGWANDGRSDHFELAIHEEGQYLDIRVEEALIEQVDTTSTEQVQINGSSDEDVFVIDAGTETTVRAARSVAVLEQGSFVATITNADSIEVRNGVIAPLLQNSRNHLDVSGDGQVTALDALRVINFLNTVSDRDLGKVAEAHAGDLAPWLQDQSWVDVSGDNLVTARDALLIINSLNATSNN